MVEGEDANRNENRERHEKLPCVEQSHDLELVE